MSLLMTLPILECRGNSTQSITSTLWRRCRLWGVWRRLTWSWRLEIKFKRKWETLKASWNSSLMLQAPEGKILFSLQGKRLVYLTMGTAVKKMMINREKTLKWVSLIRITTWTSLNWLTGTRVMSRLQLSQRDQPKTGKLFQYSLLQKELRLKAKINIPLLKLSHPIQTSKIRTYYSQLCHKNKIHPRYFWLQYLIRRCFLNPTQP